MDPPIFGRGPKGEIWRLHESLPLLVEACVRILSDRPVGVLMNAYATAISSLTLYNILTTAMKPYSGDVVAGELVLQERTAHRPLSAALYAYWQNRETG
jgi:23S rRNA (cytosine1962-C5)-methyltransferase